MSSEWSFALLVTGIGLYLLILSNHVSVSPHISFLFESRVTISVPELRCYWSRLANTDVDQIQGIKRKLILKEIIEDNHIRDSRVICFRLPPCPALF